MFILNHFCKINLSISINYCWWFFYWKLCRVPGGKISKLTIIIMWREPADNQRMTHDLIIDMKKLVKKHSELGLLPMECNYLNRNAFLAAAGQQVKSLYTCIIIIIFVHGNVMNTIQHLLYKSSSKVISRLYIKKNL